MFVQTQFPRAPRLTNFGPWSGSTVPSWDKAKSQFAPVTEADLTLSFDHRVLDGGAAGRLLARIVELLQTPERL